MAWTRPVAETKESEGSKKSMDRFMAGCLVFRFALGDFSRAKDKFMGANPTIPSYSDFHILPLPMPFNQRNNLTIICLAALTSMPCTSPAKGFGEDIAPFLNQYCVSCHGPEKQKAKLRLDTLDRDLVNGTQADMWQEVLDLVNVSEMPPEEAKAQPSREERQAAIELLTAELRKVLESKRSTGGRNVLRRLTAYEYSNTLRDLLGLDLNFAADLPPEGTAAEGFVNNSSVLGTSALHIEYFERIARDALGRILLAPDEKPPAYFARLEPEKAFPLDTEPASDSEGTLDPKTEKAKKPKRRGIACKFTATLDGEKRGGLFKLDYGELSEDRTGIVLSGNRPGDPADQPFANDHKVGGLLGDGRSGWQPEFRMELDEPPYDAPVRIRIRAAAIPGKGGTFPRMSIELGSFRGNNVSDQKEAANIEVTSTNPEIYEFIAHAANFPFRSNKPGRPSYFRIYNDFRRGTSGLAYEDLPKLLVDWVEIEGNYFPEWPTPQKAAILIDSPNQSDEDAYTREILANFMPRAYRRPVSDAEVERKVTLFKKLRPTETSFGTTIVSTLATVLCSSHFLMVAEPAPGQQEAPANLSKRPLNPYELASRLSYFLWSSMPDTTLFGLAADGTLQDPQVLRGQVQRMLNDPKSKGFSQNFAIQWLDLPGIHKLAVNPEYFAFEDKDKTLFEEETTRFLDHILRENLPVQNFIDSDFAVLNHQLAKHYRIPGISGGFQVHNLDKRHHRGGVLTQASMLFANSTGSETHPIRRGIWVLERMLDAPPPPPPPNVPALKEPEAKDETGLSLKERLVAHAEVESCKDCHSKIDPWGVAFENYNALGQWREGDLDPNVKGKHQKVTIDPSTRLKNGKEIQNLDGLKTYILTEREAQFRKAVVRKTMAYALGRYLEFQDRPAIDTICQNLEAKGDKFQTLLEEITLSAPFLTK